jgi:hypothetical protein
MEVCVKVFGGKLCVGVEYNTNSPYEHIRSFDYLLRAEVELFAGPDPHDPLGEVRYKQAVHNLKFTYEVKEDDMKKIDDIKEMKKMIGALPIEWDVHLTADIVVDDMKITVTFDRPVGNSDCHHSH